MKTIIAILAVSTCAFGQSANVDFLVIPGAGSTGSWTTRIDLVNPSPAPLAYSISPDRSVPPPPSAAGADPFAGVIPANGSVRLDPVGGALATLVVAFDDRRPTVRARVSVEGSPLAAELPVASWKAVSGRPRPDLLAFPGIRRGPEFGFQAGPTTHVNLVLSVLAQGQELNGDDALPEPVPFTALVELFDDSGALLASRSISGCGSFPCGDAVVHDVVGGMGVGAIENAQLRVTRTSPGGVLWGAAAIVTDGGPVSIVPGWNP